VSPQEAATDREVVRVSARIGIVAIFHETNVFSPVPTEWGSFTRAYRGQELVEAFAGTRTVVGGFLEGASRYGWEVVPVFGGYATPAGIVTNEAMVGLRNALREELDAVGDVDGVLVELHGAMVADGDGDPEEEFLQGVLDRWRSAPSAVVLDLHANMGCPRLERADILTGYRTNPHVDTYERGVAASGQLQRLLDGADSPYRAHRGLPLIAPPVAQRTDAAPLRELLAQARRLERDLGLDDVTVHAGFAYADVPHLGMGFSASAPLGRQQQAETAVETLAAAAWQHGSAFDRPLLNEHEAFTRAVTLPGLVAVADTGDNINGGAPGDGTWLLHEAVARSDARTLASLWDPVALAEITTAAPGATFRLELGGRSTTSSGPALELEVEVVRIRDGSFTNSGPMATGARVSMGTAAVVRHNGVDIVVQQHPVQPNDPELFRFLGLQPEEYDVVLLKGAAAVRAGWAGLAREVVDAATRGVTDSDLTRLDFHRAPPDLVRAGGCLPDED
jgi:microcystin degradation protein MlrC